jgi:hypothetical protein
MSMERLTEISDNMKGSELITDTLSHTGNWKLIIPYENTVFTTLTDTGRTGNAIAGETFPANFPIYGKFTEIKLASGACIAYR